MFNVLDARIGNLCEIKKIIYFIIHQKKKHFLNLKKMNNTINKNEQEKKIACLSCKKSHRKCDGKRPCENCVLKSIECVENLKRKPMGNNEKNNLNHNFNSLQFKKEDQGKKISKKERNQKL
eukprot:TRINITY_DN5509_c0_g1_i4.p1 TRINITY_DN5509_c0_g1~~TRINITY_DN5509_c0_g1_i4.p1  ORF type:complete len:122 (-),score=19.31 TRINITY_DN5509_c0_g1_i4:63-428(-)